MNGTVRIAITQGYSEGDYVTSQRWASDQRAVSTDADRPLLERACLDIVELVQGPLDRSWILSSLVTKHGPCGHERMFFFVYLFVLYSELQLDSMHEGSSSLSGHSSALKTST